MPPSGPSANTAVTFGAAPAVATAGAGPEVSVPPKLLHPVQAPELYHLCQTFASVPRTNTSMRPGPQDTAAGLAESTPPSEVQPPQVPLASWTFSCSV